MKRYVASVVGIVALMLSGTVVTAPTASAASSSRCGYTNSEPVLSRGSTGIAVKQVQCELFYSLSTSNLVRDGIFGAATQADVKKFQACAGLTTDGIVGEFTWYLLNRYTAASSPAC
ncbi:peptidoglycan-binding domain-containing protein [Streptomyces sp. NPDC048215]|uniref:peptidoglycan-binding domain-containing protein n=1 Tax=Streptomyces sp. NPDC048215 TaxID=3156690 RepID=UPI0033F6BC62